MRKLVVRFQDADHFTQEWTHRKEGKEEVGVFKYARKNDLSRPRGKGGLSDAAQQAPSDRAGKGLDEPPVEEELPPRGFPETQHTRFRRELAMWQVET
jgi:hypothetical protein